MLTKLERAQIFVDVWRVLRGGSWLTSASNALAAARGSFDAPSRYSKGGFRIVAAPRKETRVREEK